MGNSEYVDLVCCVRTPDFFFAAGGDRYMNNKGTGGYNLITAPRAIYCGYKRGY